MAINSALEVFNESTGEFEPYITDSSIVSSALKNQITELQNTISEFEEIINGLTNYAEG